MQSHFRVCAHTPDACPSPILTLWYTQKWQLAPIGGELFMNDIISLVIAPLFVGLVLVLVDHWLDD